MWPLHFSLAPIWGETASSLILRKQPVTFICSSLNEFFSTFVSCCLYLQFSWSALFQQAVNSSLTSTTCWYEPFSAVQNSIYSFITALIHPSNCFFHQADCSLALGGYTPSVWFLLCPFTLHFSPGRTWIYINNTLILICVQSSGSYFMWTNFCSYFDAINLKYSFI